jgi:hypothetical protein
MALIFKGGTVRISQISAASPAASGTNEYDVEKITYKPTSSTVSWTGISGETRSETTSSTWTAEIVYLQDDLNDDLSLANLLFDYEGSTAELEYQPYTDGPTYTSNVTLVPGDIGSDGTSIATATVSLASDKPVRSPGV